jgi:hypothetical protein
MVITARQRESRNIDSLYRIYLRVIALFLILFAIQYWMRLTGFFDGADFRFDTMQPHWRYAGSALAVLLPVAALGLWGGYSWGVVLWLIASLIELLMYLWFRDLFGTQILRSLFHLSALTGLVAFRAAMWKMANKR